MGLGMKTSVGELRTGPMPFSFVSVLRETRVLDVLEKASFVVDSMSLAGLDCTSWRSLGRNVPCFLVRLAISYCSMTVGVLSADR